MPISSVYEIIVSGEWSTFLDVLSTTGFLSGIALIVVAFASGRGKHLGILIFADSMVGIINAALLHIVLDMGSYYRILIVPMPGMIMISLLLLALFISGVYQSAKKGSLPIRQ